MKKMEIITQLGELCDTIGMQDHYKKMVLEYAVSGECNEIIGEFTLGLITASERDNQIILNWSKSNSW